MVFVTRYTDYAVQAIRCAVILQKDSKGKNFTVQDIAQELGLPKPHLRRIFQMLAKNGILCSHKGRTGGFSLKVDPKKISFADIMVVFQGPINLTHCYFKKDVCSKQKKCYIRKRLKNVESIVRKELANIKLYDKG